MSGDVRKLIGGYATGTLTPAEQQALFEAALSDQDLFDSLAEEQALVSFLEDREVRSRLLDALGPVPAAQPPNWQPAGWLFAAAVASCTLIIFFTALRPPPRQVADKTTPVFSPPSGPKRNRPVTVVPMDPPPPLPVQGVPNLRALASIQPKLERPQRRMKVAVLDFNAGHGNPELGQSVSNFVSDKLVSDNIYSVIDRNRVQSAASQSSGAAPTDPASAARIGRRLGADAVILGRVLEPADALPSAVTASLIDSATGKKLRDVQTATLSNDLKATARLLGTALEAQGRVTGVNTSTITIDIGSRVGLKQGDLLRISRNGKRLGTFTVTTSAETFSVGQYTGEVPKVGDRAAFR